ncbi:MAG: hypothetical protein AABZ60_10755 [Planctomycetota bacterium]
MNSKPFTSWVDRGWYLALFYREGKSKNFRELLNSLRGIGRFANLLDENAEIVYRNILRDSEIHSFLPLLPLLANQKGTEFFMNGTPLSLQEVQEILECRIRHLSQPYCQDFAVPGRFLGCGQGILFDLTLSKQGRYWFEFYRWKNKALFVLDRPLLETFFHQTPRQNSCVLSLKQRIQSCLNQLPLELDIDSTFNWKLTLKAKFWPSWMGSMAQQDFVALSNQLPKKGDALLFQRQEEGKAPAKIILSSLQGIRVGHLVPTSFPSFSLLKQEKLLAQVTEVEDYYFRFRLLPLLPKFSQKLTGLTPAVTVHPCPENTEKYQQFLQHFFPEEELL